MAKKYGPYLGEVPLSTMRKEHGLSDYKARRIARELMPSGKARKGHGHKPPYRPVIYVQPVPFLKLAEGMYGINLPAWAKDPEPEPLPCDMLPPETEPDYPEPETKQEDGQQPDPEPQEDTHMEPEQEADPGRTPEDWSDLAPPEPETEQEDGQQPESKRPVQEARPVTLADEDYYSADELAALVEDYGEAKRAPGALAAGTKALSRILKRKGVTVAGFDGTVLGLSAFRLLLFPLLRKLWNSGTKTSGENGTDQENSKDSPGRQKGPDNRPPGSSRPGPGGADNQASSTGTGSPFGLDSYTKAEADRADA